MSHVFSSWVPGAWIPQQWISHTHWLAATVNQWIHNCLPCGLRTYFTYYSAYYAYRYDLAEPHITKFWLYTMHMTVRAMQSTKGRWLWGPCSPQRAEFSYIYYIFCHHISVFLSHFPWIYTFWFTRRSQNYHNITTSTHKTSSPPNTAQNQYNTPQYHHNTPQYHCNTPQYCHDTLRIMH